MAPINGSTNPNFPTPLIGARAGSEPRPSQGRGRSGGGALASFVAVRDREIPNFERVQLPTDQNVVVTGGTGCIGTAILHLLRDHGVRRLTSISRHAPAPDRHLAGIEYALTDIRDPAGVQRVLASTGADLVIHLAGQRQPDLAELQAGETISSNVLGTMTVLEAAGRTGVGSVVTASTGKALRFFAPEVYAASKKLGEYLVSRALDLWGVSCATVRFTHVVDNSLIYGRLRRWAREGQPVRLHAPGIGFYAQSAREAAQLLAVASAGPSPAPAVYALTDIGWPHDLLALARDVIDDEASTSFISYSGYEPGYEDRLFPGTFDPLREEGSPLFNALEAARAEPALPGNAVESVSLATDPDRALDEAMAGIERCWHDGPGDLAMRSALHEASVKLLRRTFSNAAPHDLAHICRLAFGNVEEIPEHAFVYRHLVKAAEAAGALDLAGAGAPTRS